jgi:hypothetical protein
MYTEGIIGRGIFVTERAGAAFRKLFPGIDITNASPTLTELGLVCFPEPIFFRKKKPFVL